MERAVARDDENKFQGRKRTDPSPSKVRSAVTNGSKILTDCDHRGAWARRLKDLISNFLADISSSEPVSEAQKALVRRAAMLCLQLELLEQQFAENEGQANAQELEVYQRCCNTLRRTLGALGLKRHPRGGTDEDAITKQFFEELQKSSEAA